MARHAWTVPCQRIIVDSETNLATYVDTVRGVRVDTLPATLPGFAVATVWNRDQSDEILVVRLRVVSPSGQNETSITTEPITMGRIGHRANFWIEGLRVEEAGQHVIHIDQRVDEEWRTVDEVPIAVTKATASDDE